MRPHEHTHASVRAERLELMRATRANLSPIFGALRRPGRHGRARPAGAGSGRATRDAGDRRRRHRAPLLAGHRRRRRSRAVQDAMADREILIADGHHRYETALAYRDERRARRGRPGGRPAVRLHPDVPRATCSDEGLAIYPTHRVVMSQRDVDRRLPAGVQQSASCRRDAGGGGRGGAERGARSDTIAFAVWRGTEQPALLAELQRHAAAMLMAMPGVPGARCARSTPPCCEALVLSPLLGLDGEQFLTTDGVRYVRGLDACDGAGRLRRGRRGVPAARPDASSRCRR